MGVDVRLDEQERIIAVSLASHRETPAYLYGVAEWLGGAVGKSAPDLEYGTASGNSVDAFSGATVTGEAIVRAIRCAGGHIREQRTGVAMPGDDEIGRSSGHTNAVAGGLLPLLGSAFLLILGLSVCLYGGWRIRVVFLVVLAAVVGGISNHQLALDSVLGIIAGPRPPLSNLGVWLPFAALIAGGFLCGGVFCGNLCPAGAVFELISLVGLRWRPPGSWERRLRQVKYLLALALLAAFLVTGLRDLLAGDPLLTMFRWQGGRRGWILVGLILASNLLWFRAWCRYLCPLGALASLMEMFGGVVRLAPQRRFAACHIGVANSTDLDCLRCNRCVREPRVRTKVKTSAFATALLLLILTAIVVAGVARVSIVNADNSSLVTTTAPSNVQDRQIPVSSSEEDDFQISGTSDMSADGPHIPKAKSEGPRLYRRDNNAYHYQRTIDLRTLRDWFRTGRLSKREAMHYLRVPVQP